MVLFLLVVLAAVAFEYINGMQTPALELKLAKLFGYLPGKIAVAKKYRYAS